MERLSGAMIQATVYGQKLGPAVVASLRAIAIELASKAVLFGLLNMFTGGTYGGMANFIGLATGSGMTPNPPSPSVQGTGGINISVGTMIGDDKDRIRDAIGRAFA